MSFRRGLGSFVLAAWALAVNADPPSAGEVHDEEVERYARLVVDIRDFDRFSNAEINDRIFAGLHSRNPKVVDLAVAAVNLEARYRYHRGGEYTAGFREMVRKRERDIARIPGIRDFLMDYARAGLAKHG